jgi:hypothetical protein
LKSEKRTQLDLKQVDASFLLFRSCFPPFIFLYSTTMLNMSQKHWFWLAEAENETINEGLNEERV